MPGAQGTIKDIVGTLRWNDRVNKIRLVAQNHAPAELPDIYASVARQVYVPHLSPDFAYIHDSPFYSRSYFQDVYDSVDAATDGFTSVDEGTLADLLSSDSRGLLVLRTIAGLTRDEFAHSTALVSEVTGTKKLTGAKVGSCEQSGSPLDADQAMLAAMTLTRAMDGSLFGEPPGELQSKQAKIDTANGWSSVESMHRIGVSYSDLLHQRHYGGAYRQLLDATSSRRGDLLEDAVEHLFEQSQIPYVRTGSHNQAEIADRFGIVVRPAPDFVVYDSSSSLRAMLECKLVNDGGTARDKALRFERLRDESMRLGGIPLVAVLGGMGWVRVGDALGPVVRDTDGRVFTLATLPEMLEVAPFSSLAASGAIETAVPRSAQKTRELQGQSPDPGASSTPERRGIGRGDQS